MTRWEAAFFVLVGVTAFVGAALHNSELLIGFGLGFWFGVICR